MRHSTHLLSLGVSRGFLDAGHLKVDVHLLIQQQKNYSLQAAHSEASRRTVGALGGSQESLQRLLQAPGRVDEVRSLLADVRQNLVRLLLDCYVLLLEAGARSLEKGGAYRMA